MFLCNRDGETIMYEPHLSICPLSLYSFLSPPPTLVSVYFTNTPHHKTHTPEESLQALWS